jgi:hypothetical protein
MSGWLSAFVAIAALGLILARLLVKPILALTSTPQDDLARIRANLEGPAGEAGPSMHVVDITRAGITLPGRTQDAERSYRVMLRRTDGTTEQRTVRIEVAFLGEGGMSIDPKTPRPSLDEDTRNSPIVSGRTRYPQGSKRWRRLANDLQLLLPAMGAGVFFVAITVLPALPFISEAENQLRYVLHRGDVRVIEFYSRGDSCGVYTTGGDRRPMWFRIEDNRVSWGAVRPGGVSRDAPYGSLDPYDQWSRCVSYAKGGRGDDGFAVAVLSLFH